MERLIEGFKKWRLLCWVLKPSHLCFCSSAHWGTRAGWAGSAPAAVIQGGTAHKCHVHRELRDGASRCGKRGTYGSHHTGSLRRKDTRRGSDPRAHRLSPETSSRGEGRAPLPTPARFHHRQFLQGEIRGDIHPLGEQGRRRPWRRCSFKPRSASWAQLGLCDCCFAWKLIWCILGK